MLVGAASRRNLSVKKYVLRKPTGLLIVDPILLESVQNLQHNLQQLGGNLIVRVGIPEFIIPELCKRYNITSVYFSKEVTPEEVRVENAVEKELIKRKPHVACAFELLI